MTKTPPVNVSAAVLASCLLAGLAGCGDRPNGERPAARSVQRSAGEGPVTVSFSATPAELEVGEHATLRLEIVADKDVTVLDHRYEHLLKEGDRQFQLRATLTYSEAARPVGDGKLRWTYLYEVEFFLPGEHELPGATVEFGAFTEQTGQEASKTLGETETKSLATEPITLVVRTPADGTLSAADLRDIPRLEPVELPADRKPWFWIALAAVALAFAALWLVQRLRRERPIVMTPVSPHEWAQRQIASLVAEDLIAQGRVQEFFYRLSGIVRGYIERRFCVSAPEMTTEEFLACAAGDRRLGAWKAELQGFLNACDLVKYARHQPAREESAAMLRAAADFIDRTREETSSATPEASLRPTVAEPLG